MVPMFDLVERLISTSSDSSIDECLDEPVSEPATCFEFTRSDPATAFEFTKSEPTSALSSGPLSPSNSGVFGSHLFPGRQRMYSECDSGIGSVRLQNGFIFIFAVHSRYFIDGKL
jgi:hypothetical protein